MKQLERKNYNYALPVLISLFFVWGFLTSMNDVLIPFLKSVFTLTYTQAMIIQFSFFGAYFIGSLIYFIISSIWGDPINHIGYKNGIVLGLFMSAIGTGMFYPAAVIVSYGMFLTGLFILGLGFTLLQISSNPYVAILGSPQTASSRLNLAQGFNSLGTTLAPLLGGYLIFKLFVGDEFQNADALIYPYMAFTVIFILLGIAFLFIKLPDYKDTNEYSSLKITHYPQLVWGIIAIFMYVGAEVSIGSMLISFLKQPNIGNMNEFEARNYVSLYWTGLMIGRFLGSVLLTEKQNKNKIIGVLTIIALAFLFLWYIHSLSLAYTYIIFIIICSGLLWYAKNAHHSLSIFAIINIVLLLIVINAAGTTAIWAVVLTGLFNSIMWSNIFTLSIDGLGIHTSQASSLLVMAIVGGAILPLVMGFLADHWNVQHSFIIPMIGFIYITFYGIWGYKKKNFVTN